MLLVIVFTGPYDRDINNPKSYLLLIFVLLPQVTDSIKKKDGSALSHNICNLVAGDEMPRIFTSVCVD